MIALTPMDVKMLWVIGVLLCIMVYLLLANRSPAQHPNDEFGESIKREMEQQSAARDKVVQQQLQRGDRAFRERQEQSLARMREETARLEARAAGSEPGATTPLPAQPTTVIFPGSNGRAPIVITTKPGEQVVLVAPPPPPPPPPPALTIIFPPMPPPIVVTAAVPLSDLPSANPPLPALSNSLWSIGAFSGKAWLGYYGDVKDDQVALAPLTALQRHGLVVGGSGMGKSRLTLLLAGEALGAGWSVAALELKKPEDLLGRLCALADAVGLPEYNRALFLPGFAPGPGWNPLLGEAPLAEKVSELLDVFRALAAGSWGPKMDKLFRAALTVLAANGLSLFELPSLLSNPRYAKALIAQATPPHPEDATAVQRACETLQTRAAGDDPDPVINKVDPMLVRPFFEKSLCAGRNTFAMEDLWQSQTLAGFHLDRKRLGEDGAMAFGAMALRRLFAASLEPAGYQQVLLLADEAGEVDRLSGGRLERTISEARSSRLSVLLSCQHLSQLPSGLRESALTSAGVRCFFRLGPDDARAVGRILGSQWEGPLQQLGAQECVVQVDGGSPRQVDVADVSPVVPAGWAGAGQRLSQEEWDTVGAWRTEGMAAVVSASMPPLDGRNRRNGTSGRIDEDSLA